MKLILMILLVLTGCAKSQFGVKKSAPLYSAHKQGWSKHLFVEVELNGKGPHVFLVSPSISTSRIHPNAAKTVGLTSQQKGKEQSFVKVDIGVGDKLISDQALRLGSKDMPETVSSIPLAGYLGSDFLHHFVAEIDYAQQTLRLTDKTSAPVLQGSAPLKWIKTEINAHQYIISLGLEIKLQLEGDDKPKTIMASLSADGGGLSLPKAWLQKGNVQKASITIGDQAFALDAKPNNTDKAKLGMDFISDKRLIIDYANKQIKISSPFKRTPKSINAFRLEQLEWSLRGEKDLLTQAKLQLTVDRYKEATESLSRHLKRNPSDIEALTLYAKSLDKQGDSKGRLQLSDSLTVAQLIERKMWVSVINGLWLDGQTEKASRLAKMGTKTVSESPQAWIAHSDILRFSGDYKQSRRAIHKGVELSGNPDAFLLRRAWSAHKDKDHLAAITYLRRMNQQSGKATAGLWFFARLYSESKHQELLKQDIMHYAVKAKESDTSLDFLAASLQEIGELKLAQQISNYGINNDCTPLKEKQDRTNCTSWFDALIGSNLIKGEQRMRRVLGEHPHRFDFIDTHAVILNALSRHDAATEQALRAAKLASADSYMLWQYDLLKAKK